MNKREKEEDEEIKNLIHLEETKDIPIPKVNNIIVIIISMILILIQSFMYIW